MPLKGENGIDVDPALDGIIGLFASCRCRCIVYCLTESDDDVFSIDDLRDYILAHDPGASDRRAVVTSLHHNLLPKLDEAGVIDFDDRSGAIRFRGIREWEEVLTAIRELEAGC